MEQHDDNILYLRQINMASKTRTTLGKPPTRLQKHAPASLELNTSTTTNNNAIASSSSSPSSSLSVIPLLSPLVTSPKALPEAVIEEKIGNEKVEMNTGGGINGGGWQHPAAAGFTDPACLFTAFQLKCLLVNDA